MQLIIRDIMRELGIRANFRRLEYLALYLRTFMSFLRRAKLTEAMKYLAGGVHAWHIFFVVFSPPHDDGGNPLSG